MITAKAVGQTKIYAVTADGGFSAVITVDVGGELPFVDVPKDAWFYSAIAYNYNNGLMVGVTNNHFAPGEIVTRATAVTVLHRIAGRPIAESEGFIDVPAGEWYTNAVHWAEANGIVFGHGDGTFDPHAPVTREDLVTILYRFVDKMGYDAVGDSGIELFSDRDETSSYAEWAMDWAISEGLLGGFPDGTIRPKAYTERAQMAVIMMHFVEYLRG